MTIIRQSITLTILVLFLASCQKTTRITDPPTKGKNPNRSFSALELQPMREGSWRFEVTEGPRTGKVLTATVKSDGLRRWRYELEATRVVFFEITENGDLTVTHEQDLEENVDVRYTPALVMLPQTLSVGQPLEDACDVVITNLKTGGIRDRGRCVYTRELIGPAAEQPNTWLVRCNRTLDLRLAKADVTIETVYLPGEGMVTERVAQETKPLGLFTIKKAEALKLLR